MTMTMKKIFNVIALLLIAISFGSCNSEMDKAEETKGYIQLEMSTIASTNTRADAPSNYDGKTLEVRILDATNKVVKETTWKDGVFANTEFASPISLTPGNYIVEAHSANWDGSGSGWNAPFYAGSASVTVTAGHLAKAKLKLTQDNVKVDVFWDKSFKDNFKSAKATISVENNEDIASRIFIMNGTEKGAAYFPAGNLEWALSATNNRDIRHDTSNVIKDVKARDYVRITYSVAEAGNTGSVDVYLDESTRTYTVTINVPRESTVSLNADRVTVSEAAAAKVGGSSAVLSGSASGKDLDKTKLFLQYHLKGTEQWTVIDNATLVQANAIKDVMGGVEVTYKVTGLLASTSYEYQLVQDGEPVVTSNNVSFTIEGEALYNGGFELWHYEGKNEIAYPTESSSKQYWSSSNPGSGSVTKSLAKLTDKTTEQVHGGTYAAKLMSKSTMSILAAASLYTGEFGDLNVSSQTASLKWGIPFTGRPASLHGYMMYKPGNVDITATKAKDGTPLPSEAPGSGQPDHCHIFCALMNINSPLEVNNGNLSTFPTWTNRNDSRIVAYGIKVQKTAQDGWVEFDIPLDYYQLDVKPKYLIIVAAASKYGDYFHGSSKSVLYLDDFELKY